ncbi:MAG: AGE family epimerase/isomerase [Spirochaetales bacterium]|nr:AGE family epimerase/isomerase [Spirochaetales bacterium]
MNTTPNDRSAAEYYAELLDRVIPFWERHSPDREYGGYFTCLERDGAVFDTDKFVWLQARQVWMFSHLYRTVERRRDWLELAALGADFLLRHGRAESGNWYFSLMRDGTPLVEPYNIFSDCFAAMAMAEYAVVSDSDEAATVARRSWRRVRERAARPKGRWSKAVAGSRPTLAMSLPMIQLNMAEVFAQTIGDEDIGLDERGLAGVLADNASIILDRHIDTERRAVFEHMLPDGSHPDAMEGRLLNPGHAAEALWMTIEAAEALGNMEWIERAREALLWTFERGWDTEHGGIYYFQDYAGHSPEKLEHDMKLWWVHLESMYAALVAADTIAPGSRDDTASFREWHDRIERYTWDRFRDPEFDEWYGYLHRNGTPSTRQKGGKWKGCFHLPRILLRHGRRLERIAADREAQRFVAEETQFHLGHLVTEQSHPTTSALSDTIAGDTAAGVRELLTVDEDIAPVAHRMIGGEAWRSLSLAIVRTIRGGGRLRISGCGSTGRLAVLLETMWRRAWLDTNPEIADRAAGIITGGDRALIKSVESFEDFQIFGRRQMADLGVDAGDLCIAISEGGETSSVIGTAWEALERGAAVFFVYNNPTELLISRTDRSRELIEHPGVVAMDLTTGAMAIAGSTRMQATSAELLVIGSAVDHAIRTLQSDRAVSEESYALHFDRLLSSLQSDGAVAALARFVEAEEEIYRRGALVTYLADRYLLDVFSDTSERTPTFNLPPMRAADERTSPPSWAFPKHARLRTREAWRDMLLRAPRGLEWGRAVYEELAAPRRFIDSPPPVSSRVLDDYRVGIEGLAERSSEGGALLIGVSSGEEDRERVEAALRDRGAVGFGLMHVAVRTVDATAHSEASPSSGDGPLHTIDIPVTVEETPTDLYRHLALKLVLNTVSTATMARMGRIKGNFMVQVDPTNKKLVDRGTRIIAELSRVPYDEACRELHRTGTLRPAELAGRSRVAATLDRLAARLDRSSPVAEHPSKGS